MSISDWSSDVCSAELRLRVLAEGLPVRLVDGEALALEEFDQLLLAGKVLLGREVDRRIGRGLEALLDVRRHVVPHLARHRQQVEADQVRSQDDLRHRSEEHTSELQSLMRSSYAVF